MSFYKGFAFNYLAPHRGRARYCNAHVCLSVCLCVCLFVRVFAKFQSVISQPFLNRSLWNLAYILRMGTPWLTNIFRILGQRSRLYLAFWSMRHSFQDRPVSKFGPPICNCDKSHFSQLPCIRRHNSVISQPITMKFGTHTGGAAGEVCHLWLPCFNQVSHSQKNSDLVEIF